MTKKVLNKIFYCSEFSNIFICCNENIGHASHLRNYHYFHDTQLRHLVILSNAVYFQYIFDITEEEEELLCSLEQADKRVDKSTENYTIGFTIMKVSEGQIRRGLLWPLNITTF